MGDLNHNNYNEELIISYLCGDLDEGQSRELEQRLESDSSFNKLYGELKTIWDLSTVSLIEKEADWKVIQQRMSTYSPKLSMWGYLTRIAAVLVVMLSVSVGLWVYWNVPGYGRWVVFETDISSDSIVLPDQSKVFLNRYSSLKYPNTFVGKSRVVSLSGEGFFEIESDKNMPFKVNIGEVEVQVLGTSFNIFENKKSRAVELKVTDGNVKFKNKTESVLISKGESAIASDENIQKGVVTDYNFLSWKTGVLEFDNSSFEEIISSVSRHYVEIESVENETGSDVLVTTKFEKLPLGDVLEELEIHFQKNFALINGNLVITD